MNSRFTLNGAIVGINEAATIELVTLPFENENQLDDLRDKHGDTHFFRREGVKIFCVALERDVGSLGLMKPVRAADYPWLISALVLEALERFFLRLGRRVLTARPLRILSSRPNDLLLSRSLPTGLSFPQWLERRVEYEC
jgi:hypothetical protein